MDGVNPTLAFAALFFGLAGHPHDAADSGLRETQAAQVQVADRLVWRDVHCADLAIARGADPWRDAFAHEFAMASMSLGVPEDVAGMDELLADQSSMSLEGSNLAIADDAAATGCGALTPKP